MKNMQPDGSSAGLVSSAMSESQINSEIKKLDNANNISDGYHTFGELYEHRISIYIALCKLTQKNEELIGIQSYFSVWRSKKHSDGSEWEGWFILGIGHAKGEQITYHLPMSKWVLCEFAQTLEKAPDWDGHTSNDVLERLNAIRIWL